MKHSKWYKPTPTPEERQALDNCVTGQTAKAIKQALIDARLREIHDILVIETTRAIARKIEHHVFTKMHSGAFRRFYNAHQMIHYAATTQLRQYRDGFGVYEHRLESNLAALVDRLETVHADHLGDMSYKSVADTPHSIRIRRNSSKRR